MKIPLLFSVALLEFSYNQSAADKSPLRVKNQRILEPTFSWEKITITYKEWTLSHQRRDDLPSQYILFPAGASPRKRHPHARGCMILFQIYNPTFARGAPLSVVTSALFAPTWNREDVESKYRCWITFRLRFPYFNRGPFVLSENSGRRIRRPKIENVL